MIITAIITAACAKVASIVVEREVVERQSGAIEKHKARGFKVGVKVYAFQGIQKGRTGVIKHVKHKWLILEDSTGDTYRLLVGNCKVDDAAVTPADGNPSTHLRG